jgi:hypothetical protein
VLFRSAFSAIYAKAEFKNTSKELVINDLQTKKRALVTISVTIHDEEEKLIFTSELEWFLTLKTN